MVQTLCKQVALPLICAAAMGGGPPPASAHSQPKASAAKSGLIVGVSDNGASMFPSAQFQTLDVKTALAKHPSLAAGYFNALASWCHHCKIVAGDVYLPVNQGLASWVRAYARALHHRPAAWAVHPYDDIRTHTTGQLRAFERVTRGPI